MSMDLYDAIAAAGLAPPDSIVWDAKIHRFATDPDRTHSKDGWYIAHDDAKGRAAAFGSWRDDSQYSWSNGTGREFTQAERQEIDRAQAKAKKDVQIAREQTALRAQRLYEQATEQVEHHAYLARKGIACPDGVRAVQGLSARAFGFDGDWTVNGLLVPMRDRKGDIRSLQLIPADASYKKLFLPGGQTAATFHHLGEIDGAVRILIAEGLATAQSLREATGLTSVVAFSAGNLTPVAEAVRGLNATAEIVLCADDDEAGRRSAEKAAKACGGRIVYPGGGVNDFNDLHAAKGLDAVRVAVLGKEEEENEDWRADLIVNHKADGSQTTPCLVHNLALILSHAKEYRGRIVYDQFAECESIDGTGIDDIGSIKIKVDLERDWIKAKTNTKDVIEAISTVASRNLRHPVRAYLDGLSWDGTERISDFFSDFFGAPKDAYHMAVAKSLFVSSVLRIRFPGCKVDTMVILEGDQGIGKTKTWGALYSPWYVEVTDSLNSKDFFIGLRGVWCADFGELDQFSKAETTRIKQILTSPTDNYRGVWGRGHQQHPRQCVFVGGTNTDDWNKDHTGARRFLPVKVNTNINVDAIASMRDQLWAEAVVIVEKGAGRWWDIPQANEHQDSSYIGDPWEDPIHQQLAYQIRSGNAEISMSTVLRDVIKIETGRQGRSDQMRVSAILKRAGWRRKQLSDGSWVYRKQK